MKIEINPEKVPLHLKVIGLLLFNLFIYNLQAQVQIAHRDVTCSGSSDGTAEVTGVNNGTPPFLYSWSNGSSTPKISNLAEGTYTVVVTDAHGCSGEKSIEIKLSMTTLQTSFSSTPESCDNRQDGSATVIVSNGTAPFSYSWSNGDATSTIENLSEGNYCLTVTDANGCHGSGCVDVLQSTDVYPVAITAKKNVSCFGGNDGSATASASGGLEPYSYLWSNGATGPTANGLKTGSYTVTATDGSGCHGKTSVSISQPAELMLDISGGSTLITFCAGTIPPSTTLNAVALGGTPPYNYSWPGGAMTVNSTGTYSCSVTDFNGCVTSSSVYVLFIPIDCPRDPNIITGPKGYDEEQWISVNDKLSYTVFFENDPDFATAPAQEVRIIVPIPSAADPYSLRLGNFGFGDFIFAVPAGASFYSNRLDVRDSLGVFVDVTAGLDVVNNEAFWIFQSLDPATGLPPNDPQSGFLPVNDSITHRGEGFVTFNYQPKSTDVTGDTISCFASIKFDINEVLNTNRWLNTVDAIAPTSTIDPLSPVISSQVLDISFSGQDDPGGCGISKHVLYFSKGEDPFNIFGEYGHGEVAHFSGIENSVYRFFSLAKDHVGNTEPMKTVADVTTTISGTGVIANIKVLIEGAFEQETGLMSTTLNDSDFIATNQPFGVSPWNYPGTEHVTDIPVGVTDWVLVELRDANAPENATASTKLPGWPRAMFLRNDGTIVDLTGRVPNIGLPTVTNNLYVVIRHRNHLAVMSSQGMTIAGGEYVYDFSTGMDKAFGGAGGYKQIGSVPPRFGMVAGDIDGDGSVFVSDYNLWATGFGSLGGYFRPDCDLDGNVFISDFNRWGSNFGLINPGDGATAKPKYRSGVPE